MGRHPRMPPHSLVIRPKLRLGFADRLLNNPGLARSCGRAIPHLRKPGEAANSQIFRHTQVALREHGLDWHPVPKLIDSVHKIDHHKSWAVPCYERECPA